jgi:inosine/xanthosine triphosphate pyrophosphatase family protein
MTAGTTNSSAHVHFADSVKSTATSSPSVASQQSGLPVQQQRAANVHFSDFLPAHKLRTMAQHEAMTKAASHREQAKEKAKSLLKKLAEKSTAKLTK